MSKAHFIVRISLLADRFIRVSSIIEFDHVLALCVSLVLDYQYTFGSHITSHNVGQAQAISVV